MHDESNLNIDIPIYFIFKIFVITSLLSLLLLWLLIVILSLFDKYKSKPYNIIE